MAGCGRLGVVRIRTLAAGYSGLGSADNLDLWDLATDGRRRIVVENDDYQSITAVSFSPDSSIVAAATSDGRVWLGQTATLQPMKDPWRAHGDDAHSTVVQFSADGRTLVTAGGADDAIRLWTIDR